MKKIIFLFAFLAIAALVNAQTTYSAPTNPSFPGGTIAWQMYLDKNLNKTVPDDNAAPAGTYMVVVSFLINRDSSISDVTAISAPNPDYGMSAEAERVIKNSPKWSPAIMNGKPVNYRQREKIVFTVKGN